MMKWEGRPTKKTSDRLAKTIIHLGSRGDIERSTAGVHLCMMHGLSWPTPSPRSKHLGDNVIAGLHIVFTRKQHSFSNDPSPAAAFGVDHLLAHYEVFHYRGSDKLPQQCPRSSARFQLAVRASWPSLQQITFAELLCGGRGPR